MYSRPTPTSGTPRSDDALRWSPARTPRPPEYCGQRLADAELRREVGDRAQRRAVAAAEPRRALERRLQAAGDGAEVVDDAGVGGQLGEPVGASCVRTISAGWASPGRQPGQSRANRRVASASQRPVQVGGELGQGGERGGDGGRDLEAADRAHGPTDRTRRDRALAAPVGHAWRRVPAPDRRAAQGVRRVAGVDAGGGAGDRLPRVAVGEQRGAAGGACRRRASVVGEHRLDARRQLGGVARLEQQAGAGAVDQLGQPAGAGDDERRAAGERLEGDDAERLVQRRDDDAAGAVDGVAQPVVGQEAGEVDEVADALEVDLRLQLGEVAAAPADDALDARAPAARSRRIARARTWKPFSYWTRPHVNTSGVAPARRLARRPPRRVDAVGDQVGALGGQLEAADDLADHEPGVGDDLGRRRGPATTRRRGSCSAGPAARGRRGWPRSVPWNVATAGRRTASASVSAAQATCQSWAWTMSGVQSPRRVDELHEVVVGRGDPGDELVVGQPRQVGAGPQHPHAADTTVRRRPRVAQREQHDVVAGRAPAPGSARRRGRRRRRPTAAGTPRSASGPASGAPYRPSAAL